VIGWLVALFVVGFGYLIVALVFASRQDALFFQPKRELAAQPDEVGLVHEDVIIETPDGLRLHGWWLPTADGAHGPGAGFTLLYLHGANANLGDRVDALAFWHGLGFAILAIDYRGYGQSEGRPDEQGLYMDVHAAWHWLIDDQEIAPAAVVVAAESMGVSLATQLGLTVRPAGMVLEAGFTCAADVAMRRYPWLPVRLMMRLQLSNEDRIHRVRCPKLLVHSVEDQLVPITLGRRLERRAGHASRFLAIRGRHARACVDGGDRYQRIVREWLEGLERPPSAP
jgi:fermentation-respiration switch protein FrsA (DUF1100 family)